MEKAISIILEQLNVINKLRPESKNWIQATKSFHTAIEAEAEVIHPKQEMIKDIFDDKNKIPASSNMKEILDRLNNFKENKENKEVLSAAGLYKIFDDKDDFKDFICELFVSQEDSETPIEVSHIVFDKRPRKITFVCENIDISDIKNIQNHLVEYFEENKLTHKDIIILPMKPECYNIILPIMKQQEECSNIESQFCLEHHQKFKNIKGKITPFKHKIDQRTSIKYFEWLITRYKLSPDLINREKLSALSPIYITNIFNTIIGDENNQVGNTHNIHSPESSGITGDITIQTKKVKSLRKWIKKNPPKYKESPTEYYERSKENSDHKHSFSTFQKKMKEMGYISKKIGGKRYYEKDETDVENESED